MASCWKEIVAGNLYVSNAYIFANYQNTVKIKSADDSILTKL